MVRIDRCPPSATHGLRRRIPAGARLLKAGRGRAEVFDHPEFVGKHMTFPGRVSHPAALGRQLIGSPRSVDKRTASFPGTPIAAAPTSYYWQRARRGRLRQLLRHGGSAGSLMFR